MASKQRPRREPPAPDLDLATVLRTLGDPVRLEIVRILSGGDLHSCGRLAEMVGLPFSTCSYHLKQLLLSGVTEVHAEGTTRFQVVRRAELDSRFPGLIDLVLAAPPAPREAVGASQGAER
ncbi:helix-turn-helix domain-containing protein [Streptomyces sp. NPDC026672]|uniref:ArsR/SmtB family transcription factor n=1 Tax=unclassified Streptomyces TaxID=2593676 RepID=UPI0033E617CB